MSEFDYGIVKNPEIFEQNRLPAHSDHEWYSTTGAIENGRSDFKYLLNGIWKFAWAKNYNEAVKDFYRADYDCRRWDSIRVPAHIQTEGYGHPQYVNTQYPWEGTEELEPGDIASVFNPVAMYTKYFTLPSDEKWKRGPVRISFQGAESAIALWLNGHYIGYSEDSFTPSEFDLTEYIDRKGENKLSCMVFRFSAGSWTEDQDFFRFSGIFRDVYLYTVPSCHIEDLKVETLLDDSYKNADLVVSMLSTGAGQYRLSLSNEAGELLGGKGELSGDGRTEIRIPVGKPALWSAEEPNLYTLTIEVYGQVHSDLFKFGPNENPDGAAPDEIISENVGFRRFELIDHIMCLNGKRIVFNGTNRHEFSAESGRVMPDSDIAKDLITMKRNNINAVRTSHYPNKTALYRLADILGLYIIDETNMETHGIWDAIWQEKRGDSYAVPGDRENFRGMILDRARSMYERDKNHPSILIWSCGNESYGGTVIRDEADLFRSLDKNRLIHYEGVDHDPRYPETTDMISTMYYPVPEIQKRLAEVPDKPYINCEYAHSMGNSTGNLKEYTDFANQEPRYQGGFIWDYIDQSMTLTDKNGTEFQGYGGDFGDRPHDGSFSGNGICYAKDREPSPKMQEVKACYQSVWAKLSTNAAEIENRFLFTNTEKFRAVLTLSREDRVVCEETFRAAVAPLTTKTCPLPFDIEEKIHEDNINRGESDGTGEYQATLSFRLDGDTPWADAGYEIAWAQKPFGKYDGLQSVSDCLYSPSGLSMGSDMNVRKNLSVAESCHEVGVRNDDFSVYFSKLTGGLTSYNYGGMELIREQPRPTFWRAPTENDMANQIAFRGGQWMAASLYASPKYGHGRQMTPCKVEKGEDFVKVTFTYHLPVKPALDCTIEYAVTGDGVVQVTETLPPSAEVGELPEFGMLFTLDGRLSKVRWYGEGPEETYADRHLAKADVYAMDVEDNLSRYLVPSECGFRTGMRWAEITDVRGRGIRFDAVEPDFSGKTAPAEILGFSALPVKPGDLEAAHHTNELPAFVNTYVKLGMEAGVGGDDTWGSLTHEPYLIHNEKQLVNRFTFRGV